MGREGRREAVGAESTKHKFKAQSRAGLVRECDARERCLGGEEFAGVVVSDAEGCAGEEAVGVARAAGGGAGGGEGRGGGCRGEFALEFLVGRWGGLRGVRLARWNVAEGRDDKRQGER